MDELVMTISATARETRILLTQGPDEVMKARLRAVSTPAHRFSGPMLCEAMALWHDQRVRAVVSVTACTFFRALKVAPRPTSGTPSGCHGRPPESAMSPQRDERPGRTCASGGRTVT